MLYISNPSEFPFNFLLINKRTRFLSNRNCTRTWQQNNAFPLSVKKSLKIIHFLGLGNTFFLKHFHQQKCKQSRIHSDDNSFPKLHCYFDFALNISSDVLWPMNNGCSFILHWLSSKLSSSSSDNGKVFGCRKPAGPIPSAICDRTICKLSYTKTSWDAKSSHIEVRLNQFSKGLLNHFRD